jgi:hypothetical protein
MTMLALVLQKRARRLQIVKSYLASIEPYEPELVRVFEDYALAHRCTDRLMKATAKRIEKDKLRLRMLPPRQVLFGDGPLPAPDYEVLCGVPMQRVEAKKIMAMTADDRASAMLAHCSEHPEHKALFQNWLRGSNGRLEAEAAERMKGMVNR